MACPAIITGNEFLLRVVDHIDCQAQLLSSFGYQALGQPGSLASTVMTGLLTLFIAFFAIRLLFGPAPGARDLINDILKVGIVLTLAFSWPAFRTVVHDVVIDGPAQVATAITTPALAGQDDRLAVRLQKADVAMIELAEAGTGRNVAATIPGSPTGTSFAGTTLQDDSALGYGRMFYLSGIMGSLVLLRIIAALLLALTPLAAGMLLFEPTRGLFAGWLKGLVLAMLGSIGVTLVLAVELAVLEPWLADALRVRASGYAVPSAPTELFAIAAAFTIVQFAMIWLLAKVAFARGWPSIPIIPSTGARNLFTPAQAVSPVASEPALPSRAQRVADNVETAMRREQGAEIGRISFRSLGNGNGTDVVTLGRERLGSSYRPRPRRSTIESIGPAKNRDRKE